MSVRGGAGLIGVQALALMIGGYATWAADASDDAAWALWQRPWLQLLLGAATLALAIAVVTAAATGVAGWGPLLAVVLLLPLPAVAAWNGAPAVVRLLAHAGVHQLPVVALLAAPPGSGPARSAVRAGLWITGAVSFVELLAWQPIADLGCTWICAANPLHPAFLDRTWSQAVGDRVVLVIAAVLAVVVQATRRRPHPGTAASILLAAGAALTGLVPAQEWWPVALLSAGMAWHAALLVATSTRTAERRQRLAELVSRLATTRPETFAADVRGPSPGAALLAANAELTAGLRARLTELRTAQAHSLDAWDAARARWERDLHDGAQHLVLAASIELSLAGESAAMRAAPLVRQASEELRAISHGVASAELATGGLSEALAAAGDATGVPVLVDAPAGRRWPARVELTAYRVLISVLTPASGPVTFTLGEDGGDVVATAAWADPVVPELGGELDRVGLLGGTVDVAPGTLRLRLPITSLG
ncbi:hypothetical protein [Propionicimonas sp.]|uniref:hypothetical protein n=1 Tax=Propionicimonas sp. TaxID=1955623 RepID=UPI0039E436A9